MHSRIKLSRTLSPDDKSLQLVACEDIQSGKPVAPYYGVALLREHFNDILVTSPHIKYVNINEHFVAESTDRGSAATFARHSCDPNCQLKNVYLPSGECVPVLVALRDISVNEEVTRDYSFHHDLSLYSMGSKTTRKFTACKCFDVSCRQFIDTQRMYDLRSSLGHVLLKSHPTKWVTQKGIKFYPEIHSTRFDVELHPSVYIVGSNRKCQSCKIFGHKKSIATSGIFRCLTCNVCLCEDCFFTHWHVNLPSEAVTAVDPSTGNSYCMKSNTDRHAFSQLTTNQSLECPERYDFVNHAKVFQNMKSVHCMVCNGMSKVSRCVKCVVDVCDECWYYWHINLDHVCTLQLPHTP